MFEVRAIPFLGAGTTAVLSSAIDLYKYYNSKPQVLTQDRQTYLALSLETENLDKVVNLFAQIDLETTVLEDCANKRNDAKTKANNAQEAVERVRTVLKKANEDLKSLLQASPLNREKVEKARAFALKKKERAETLTGQLEAANLELGTAIANEETAQKKIRAIEVEINSILNPGSEDSKSGLSDTESKEDSASLTIPQLEEDTFSQTENLETASSTVQDEQSESPRLSEDDPIIPNQLKEIIELIDERERQLAIDEESTPIAEAVDQNIEAEASQQSSSTISSPTQPTASTERQTAISNIIDGRATHEMGKKMVETGHPYMKAFGLALMVLGTVAVIIGALTLIGTLGFGTIPGAALTAGGSAAFLTGAGLFASSFRKSHAKEGRTLHESTDRIQNPEETPGLGDKHPKK